MKEWIIKTAPQIQPDDDSNEMEAPQALLLLGLCICPQIFHLRREEVLAP